MATNGKLNREISGEYHDFLKSTVTLSADFCPRDLTVPVDGNKAKVKVINLYPDQIINFATEEWLEVSDGVIKVNVDDDVLKLSVVERYGKNGQVGSAFVRGFKLNSGALASSVAHDHHNIVIVGTNDQDMYLAAKEL